MAEETVLLEQRYSANLEAPALARRALTHALSNAKLEKEHLQNLLLVCSEWMANLVKHTDNKPDKVWLKLASNGQHEYLEIIDDGGTFHNYEDMMADRDAAPFDVELGESGLGLRLIRHMFPQNSYRSEDIGAGIRNFFRVVYRQAPARVKRLRIAVIDDDASMRTVLEAYLAGLYDVVTFEEAHAALTYLQEHSVDLVISDIQMPGMDGMEFRRELSERPDTDIIPFIFLTSDEGEQMQDEAADLGVDDYLCKPITKPRLLNVSKRLLKRAQHLRRNVGLQLEEKVTQTLAPSLPASLANFNCVVRTISAEAGGGDFLAHIDSENGVKIFFGDVMGHGLQAKFFAHAHVGYLNGILRSLEKEADIGTLLSKFSDAIENDALLESTTLTCLGIALQNDGTVYLANAAHPKPWCLTHDPFDAELVSDVGALLGLISGTEYIVSENKLKVGERMILYTDGFIEIGHNPQERDASEARIPGVLAELDGQPLEQFANALYDDFMTRCQYKPQDDMTLVVLEYVGEQTD